MRTPKIKLLLFVVPVLAATVACNSSSNQNSTTATPSSNTATSQSGDKVGVAECDDFLAKYESCLQNKVPEAARGTFKSGADSLRQTWKQSASTTQGRISLAITCSAARESAKQAMMQYGCEL